MKVRFLPEAEDDLDEGFVFYQKRQPGLGYELIDEVNACVNRIVADPERWQRGAKGTQRCRTHRFPYDLIYTHREQEILIVAVMQLHRRPGYWKRRI